MQEKKDLLEALAQRLDCAYLSDLRTKEFQARAIRAALDFSPEDYSAFQWRDAASYLLNLAERPNTTEEAREVLRNWEAAPFKTK
ncbi:hypothetical protein OBV_00680 [Oscillibacter valericigenes Sjm18-20]|nr:hypothetical protein OBV_00680 [Oscillibacter valericigenes Sjm18-20]